MAYFVTDLKAHGFKRVTSMGTTSGPITDEQKAARKNLIANNKA